MRNFSEKSRKENQNLRFMFNNFFSSRKSCGLCECAKIR